MGILVLFFLGMAIVLWLSLFGYIAVLSIINWSCRHQVTLDIKDWPSIAVVIPTLDEEELIRAKLADLRYIDYPTDRLHILVIDGGSSDRTSEVVQREIDGDDSIRLVCIPDARNKIDQVVHALEILEQEFIIFTDADTKLVPTCIKELVRLLLSDPHTAVVGATVRPESRLIEEQIHWSFLNYLWRLEGEVLSAAGFSGVCYAIRRKPVKLVKHDIKAEDIHLALLFSANGHRVRLCDLAIATELRVPQTAQELLQFRRRRGSRYITALRNFKPYAITPLSWRILRGVRLWQFTGIPWLGIALVALGLILAFTQYWAYLIITSFAFIIPAFCAIHILGREIRKNYSWGKLILALFRYSTLTLISLMTMNKQYSTNPFFEDPS